MSPCVMWHHHNITEFNHGVQKFRFYCDTYKQKSLIGKFGYTLIFKTEQGDIRGSHNDECDRCVMGHDTM